jgi:hypothetical protein
VGPDFLNDSGLFQVGIRSGLPRGDPREAGPSGSESRETKNLRDASRSSPFAISADCDSRAMASLKKSFAADLRKTCLGSAF